MFHFFFKSTATTMIYTLSLHDALPIYVVEAVVERLVDRRDVGRVRQILDADVERAAPEADRRDGIHERQRLHAALAERGARSEEHTSELQSRLHLVCRLLLEKKKKKNP